MIFTPKTDFDAERLDDAALVAHYLDACPILIVAATLYPDPLTDGALLVPVGTASDGTYAWPLSTEYFTSVHGLAPAREMLDHIRQQDYIPPVFTEEKIAHLRQQLLASSRSAEPYPLPEPERASDPADHLELWNELPNPWG